MQQTLDRPALQVRTVRSKARKLARARGQIHPSMLVPAARSRESIKKMLALGWNRSRIAREVGVADGEVRDIENGVIQQNRYETQLKFLSACERAVAGNARSDDFLVDAAESVLLWRSLQRIGWTGQEIADRLTEKIGSGKHYRIKRGMITTRYARGIREVFNELCMTPGKSDHTRKRAENRGWLAPLDLEV